MSQVLHTSLLESHNEALNEVDNLKHDYAIVSAERNYLKAHAERLADALKLMRFTFEQAVPASEMQDWWRDAWNQARKALAQWEATMRTP